MNRLHIEVIPIDKMFIMNHIKLYETIFLYNSCFYSLVALEITTDQHQLISFQMCKYLASFSIKVVTFVAIVFTIFWQ